MARNVFDLTGKVSLVTGANAGLGFGFARGLASAGSDVIIWGRREDKNQRAMKELAQHGVRVASKVVDVASEAAVIAGMQAVVDEFGRLDCVVANAGVSGRVAFTEMSAQAYHELLDTNLHGAFYTLREAAKHMVDRAKRGQPGGSLIICGSLSIFSGVSNMAHYAAAKGALESMSKTLAAELGPQQIRVNVIAPGFIATEMTQADPAVFKAVEAAMASKTALGRVGQPEDVAGAVVYLASDAAKYHTGDTLIIDGGQLSKLV